MASSLWQAHEWFVGGDSALVTGRASARLDYSAGRVSPPFEPVDDDQLIRNQVLAERVGGSSDIHSRKDGPLSVENPPVGVGLYNESVTLNIETDTRLADHASWRVHLGTVDDYRYPSVTTDLRRNADLGEAIGRLDSGDKLSVIEVPDWLPPGDVDLVVQGYQEELSTTQWKWTANTTPESPWRVAVAGSSKLGRADTRGSELTTAVPLPTIINGNPGFEDGLVEWGSSGLGASILELSDARTHSGDYAAVIRPDGVTGFLAVHSDSAGSGAVTEGVTYQAMAWVWSDAGYPDVRIRIDWRDAGGTIIANTSPATIAIGGSEWSLLSTEGVAPVGAVSAGVRVIMGEIPTVADLLWLDDVWLMAEQTFAVATTAVATWIDSAGYGAQFPFDIDVDGEHMRVLSVTSATSPQTFKVLRGVNGVAIGHEAGAAVRLAYPAVIAL